MRIGVRRNRLATPWIDWHGMEGSDGILNLSSITKPEIQGSAGLSLIASESSSPGGVTAPKNRLTFRVDDPRKLGQMSWESSPPRVNVAIESQIAVLADTVEWTAVLRYDVMGGALDVIHVKMPVSWSASAELRLAGDDYQLTTETRGPSALWSITPRRPIRGSQRFVLHSVQPLTGEREIVHPELTPLGKGAVDASLAIVSATARPLTVDSAVGLVKIPYSSKFQAGEFVIDTGTPVAAYQVTKEAWSLRCRPRETQPSRATPLRARRGWLRPMW